MKRSIKKSKKRRLGVDGMSYKFKVGQRVMIRPDFTKDDANQIGGYTKDMEEWRGKIVTIYKEVKYFDTYGYKIEEDRMDNAYTWAGAMLQLPFQSKEEVLEALIKGQITNQEYKEMISLA